MNEAVLCSLWGKARPHPNSEAPYHPLLYHCLDVAAVGEALLDRRSDLLANVASEVAINTEALRSFILFLLATHDVGKISRPFQGQAPEFWPADALGPLDWAPAGPRHGETGRFLLEQHFGDGTRPPFQDWRLRDIANLLAPFVGHHGRPVAYPEIQEVQVFGKECIAAVRDFLDTMTGLFPPGSLPRVQGKTIARVSWRLAGLAVLADWIGSNQTWFPYTPPKLSPADYLEHVARRRAAQAVAAAGVHSARPSLVTGYRALTLEEHEPSPVQAWAERVALPVGPLLALIEDMTGGGKTEAALILAHRLMAAGRARGLYVALPTMATANAMYERLADCYRRMFDLGARPSLALAHSATSLHSGFRDSVLPTDDRGLALERDEAGEMRGDASSAACAAWLADSRRKAFLADVGRSMIACNTREINKRPK
jgi:CRISPR-associated endonuclease/helicase Cas3